jgi:anti-sigma factor RsiW
MVDRQDIDALLISALYGELTPADEARLQVHLESHPTDRTALAGLTLARNAVRESRILQVQIEPPQAISALLLQEAARRAPAKSAPDNQRARRDRLSHPLHPALRQDG